jgi:hypothetical protein
MNASSRKPCVNSEATVWFLIVYNLLLGNYSFVAIRCRGNVISEPLLSNVLLLRLHHSGFQPSCHNIKAIKTRTFHDCYSTHAFPDLLLGWEVRFDKVFRNWQRNRQKEQYWLTHFRLTENKTISYNRQMMDWRTNEQTRHRPGYKELLSVHSNRTKYTV